jgi:hypothetical protein
MFGNAGTFHRIYDRTLPNDYDNLDDAGYPAGWITAYSIGGVPRESLRTALAERLVYVCRSSMFSINKYFF